MLKKTMDCGTQNDCYTVGNERRLSLETTAAGVLFQTGGKLEDVAENAGKMETACGGKIA